MEGESEMQSRQFVTGEARIVHNTIHLQKREREKRNMRAFQSSAGWASEFVTRTLIFWEILQLD